MLTRSKRDVPERATLESLPKAAMNSILSHLNGKSVSSLRAVSTKTKRSVNDSMQLSSLDKNWKRFGNTGISGRDQASRFSELMLKTRSFALTPPLKTAAELYAHVNAPILPVGYPFVNISKSRGDVFTEVKGLGVAYEPFENVLRLSKSMGFHLQITLPALLTFLRGISQAMHHTLPRIWYNFGADDAWTKKWVRAAVLLASKNWKKPPGGLRVAHTAASRKRRAFLESLIQKRLAYFIDTHGRLATKGTFVVPKNSAIVFLTPPGCWAYSSDNLTRRLAKGAPLYKAILEQVPFYTIQGQSLHLVTYFPGDRCHEHTISVPTNEASLEGMGSFRFPLNVRHENWLANGVNHPGELQNIFPESSNGKVPLSAIISRKPGLYIMLCCRVANNQNSLKRGSALNRNAHSRQKALHAPMHFQIAYDSNDNVDNIMTKHRNTYQPSKE